VLGLVVVILVSVLTELPGVVTFASIPLTMAFQALLGWRVAHPPPAGGPE
jgi:hypothetical protein